MLCFFNSIFKIEVAWYNQIVLEFKRKEQLWLTLFTYIHIASNKIIIHINNCISFRVIRTILVDWSFNNKITHLSLIDLSKMRYVGLVLTFAFVDVGANRGKVE